MSWIHLDDLDVRLRGPYQVWEHTHEFEPWKGGTILRDRVRYQVPFGALGALVAGSLVAKDVASIFDFRRRAIREIFGNESTVLRCTP